MAINDREIIDLLFKKIGYNFTKTANFDVKSPTNERFPSPLNIQSDNVWSEAHLIPDFPSDIETGVSKPYFGENRIQMTSDATSPTNQTWLATSTYGEEETRLTRFIDPSYGPGYIVQVFIGDPNVGPAARIFPDTTNEEYYFDYIAGVLIFMAGVPTPKTATIGIGTVNIADHGLYIQAYEYVGKRGVGGGGAEGDFVLKTGDEMTGPLQFPQAIETTIQLKTSVSDDFNFGIGVHEGENGLVLYSTEDSGGKIILGHYDDNHQLTNNLTVNSNGVVNVGGEGDAYILTSLGGRMVLGHDEQGMTHERVSIDANGVLYVANYVVYHEGNLDLSNMGGGEGIASATINSSGDLIITRTDAVVLNVGHVVGSDGVSVDSVELNTDGYLEVTYSNGTIGNAGYVGGGDSGGSAIEVKYDGVIINSSAKTLDFVGNGVSLTNMGDTVYVSIEKNGGGGSGGDIEGATITREIDITYDGFADGIVADSVPITATVTSVTVIVHEEFDMDYGLVIGTVNDPELFMVDDMSDLNTIADYTYNPYAKMNGVSEILYSLSGIGGTTGHATIMVSFTS